MAIIHQQIEGMFQGAADKRAGAQAIRTDGEDMMSFDKLVMPNGDWVGAGQSEFFQARYMNLMDVDDSAARRDAHAGELDNVTHSAVQTSAQCRAIAVACQMNV